jgi:hypothetical protein
MGAALLHQAIGPSDLVLSGNPEGKQLALNARFVTALHGS